jgi:transcriptional regulator with XRE-family HTH domain
MKIRSPTHAAFGTAIRELRKERRISQTVLADRCDLDRTYMNGIERGKRNPSLTNILKIAVALGVPTSYLLSCTERLEGADGDALRGVDYSCEPPDDSVAPCA